MNGAAAHQPSLQRAFLKLVSLPFVVCCVLFCVAGLQFIYHEVDELYDATLAQYAKEIDRLSERGAFTGITAEADPLPLKLQHKYERKIMFRILQDGKVIAHSYSSAGFDEVLPHTGFYDRTFANDRWRIFAVVNEKTGRAVQVAEKYDIRREISRQLMGSLLIPALLLLLALLAVVWWGAKRSVMQLVSVSSQVDARDVNDMTPISVEGIPREIQPLLSALNRLFARVSEGFRREREFTDNAAHELRTPLAAIKTQAQVLAKSEKLTPAGAAGLANLQEAIDRSTKMVESLLTFSRVQAAKGATEQADLSAIVRQEVDALLRVSSLQGRRLDIDAPAGMAVTGSVEGLSLLVRNIVLNALKFTPETGAVSVQVLPRPDGVLLRVADTGPGISDEAKAKVFDRFYKGSKSDASGSGLGLSIVKWIADMHGAEMTLSDNRPTGLVFDVYFRRG